MECLEKSRYPWSSKKPVIAVYDFDMTAVDTSYMHHMAEGRVIENLKAEGILPQEEPDDYEAIKNSYGTIKSTKKYGMDKSITDMKNAELLEIAGQTNKILDNYFDEPQKITADEADILAGFFRDVKIYEELIDTWDYLKKKGVEIAICTNAHSQYFDFVCKLTGLDKQIKKYGVTVVTADDFTNGKPHHEPIEKVIDEAAYNAGFDWHGGVRVVKIGDMRRDMESAFMANELPDECDVLGLLFADSGNVPDDMDGYGNAISRHSELRKIIEGLDKNMDDALEEQKKFFG